MKDRVVQYPNRYRMVPVEGQEGVIDLVAVPGEVTAQGSAYNKANILTDVICDSFRLPNTSEPKDAFLKSATAFRGTAVTTKNIAWLLSNQEIAGKVQEHSHIFYDVFYPSHSKKIGYFDNRFISVSGTLDVGVSVISAESLDLTSYPLNDRFVNPNWQSFTLSDGVSRELVHAKESPLFNAQTYTGGWPATIVAAETTVNRVALMGGKGRSGNAEGGKGGTVIVELPVSVGDVLTIEKVDGSGKGMRIKKNGTIMAVAGGGGGYGVILGSGDQVRNKGGDGGGDAGEDGQGQAAAKGAVGNKGGVGSTQYGATGESGKDAPDGRGGLALINPGGSFSAGGLGGGGYAGGGAGSAVAFPSGLYISGAGGGASSYVAAGLTVIENSRGTNGGAEYALISKSKMELKEPIKHSYTDPILYRSNLDVDTTTHIAKFKKVKNASMEVQEVRLLIKDYMDFIDFALWLMVKNIRCLEVRLAYGLNSAIDESNFNNLPVYESPTVPKEIHIDGDNRLERCQNIALTLTLETTLASEILQMFGCIA